MCWFDVHLPAGTKKARWGVKAKSELEPEPHLADFQRWAAPPAISPLTLRHPGHLLRRWTRLLYHAKAQNQHLKIITPLTNHNLHRVSLLFFSFWAGGRWLHLLHCFFSRILSSLVSRFHQTSVLFALWHRWHRFVFGQRTLLTHFFSCLQLLSWGYLQPAHWPIHFFFSRLKNKRTVKRPKKKNLVATKSGKEAELLPTASNHHGRSSNSPARIPLLAPSHLLTLALTLLSQPPSDQSVIARAHVAPVGHAVGRVSGLSRGDRMLLAFFFVDARFQHLAVHLPSVS